MTRGGSGGISVLPNTMLFPTLPTITRYMSSSILSTNSDQAVRSLAKFFRGSKEHTESTYLFEGKFNALTVSSIVILGCGQNLASAAK